MNLSNIEDIKTSANKQNTQSLEEIRTKLNNLLKNNTDGDIQHYQIRSYQQLFDNIEKDPQKEFRIRYQQCKLCFYRERIAFQAFTDSSCRLCKTTIHNSSSDVANYCQPCSEEHNCCAQCGSNVEN